MVWHCHTFTYLHFQDSLVANPNWPLAILPKGKGSQSEVCCGWGTLVLRSQLPERGFELALASNQGHQDSHD